ncbi:MAG: nuclear transport factor 2 family protein [Bradyrhizobium sp.]|jgi:hypothetical protein
MISLARPRTMSPTLSAPQIRVRKIQHFLCGFGVASGRVVLTNPEQIREYFDGALKRYKPRTAKLDASETFVVDDNTVVIAGFDSITGVRDGLPMTDMSRVTFVIANRGSDWLIVHFPRSPLPTT